MTEPVRPVSGQATAAADVDSSGEAPRGPVWEPKHPLAKGPVARPPHSVDGFVREFLRELNFGQGVALTRSTTNDQYLALARTVRHYLMADWLETARRRRETRPP